jgi:hypothetical protein
MDALDKFMAQEDLVANWTAVIAGQQETLLKRAAQACFTKLQTYYVQSDDSHIYMVAFCKFFIIIIN